MKRVIETAVVVAFGLCPSAALARAPYYVDDAGIIDPGKVQSANWFSHSDTGDNLGVASAAFQTFSGFETTIQASRVFGSEGADTTATFQGKYLWHDAADSSAWGSSLAGGVNADVWRGAVSGAYAYVPVTLGVTVRTQPERGSGLAICPAGRTQLPDLGSERVGTGDGGRVFHR